MKVTLVDAAASDLAVVNAARVSFDKEAQRMEEGDEKLIKFLMRERHGTPFEHGFFKFRIEAPIFVFREWHRHRVGWSYNEMSGRYVKLHPTFYKPSSWRKQEGKPGAYTYVETGTDEYADDVLTNAYKQAWEAYESLLERGVAKEQARAVLPVGTYSQMIASCNPRSLMHFLGLRTAPNAQAEIRQLAREMESHFAASMPATWAAFIDNNRTAP